MRWHKDRSEYELKSGRRVYANRGILGLSPADGAALRANDEYEHELSHGYDGTVFAAPFTRDERAEIASAMIRAWRAWAKEVGE